MFAGRNGELLEYLGGLRSGDQRLHSNCQTTFSEHGQWGSSQGGVCEACFEWATPRDLQWR